MSFEELQEAWQEQNASGQVKVESSALLKLVRRNHQVREKMSFQQDVFLGVVFGLIYVPLWIWLGVSKELPWSWYLHIPAFLWVAGFVVWNRLTRRKKHLRPEDSIRVSVEYSLTRINQQIRMQKAVLWWYLLPPAIPMAVFFIHCGLLSGNIWGTVHHLIVEILIFWGAYELIHRYIRKDLEPQREELEEFLKSLDHTTETDASADVSED